MAITQEYDFALSHNLELFSKLNDIKLWEAYQKLRASHLLFHFNKINTHNVIASYRINHQKVTIHFELNFTSAYKIGIQIEDNQYRKFIIGPNHSKFAENLRINNIFFDDKWNSPQSKNMMGYNPNFKYQYNKIRMIKFEELFKKINEDFLIIQKNMNKIRNLIPNS